jgi:hypothetical protein
MPQNGKNRDGDGLSFPDDATLARLRAQVDPPNPADWADATAMLLWAAELERRGERNPALPPGMTAVEYGLRAIVSLLQRQPALMRHGALLPPNRLLAAIGDLAAGHEPPLFQRIRRPRGHPGKRLEEAVVMGLAARTVTILLERGDVELDGAAQRVANTLNANTGKRTITGTIVKNWRFRFMASEGPQDAVKAYNDPFPELDADQLLRQLKGKGAMLRPRQPKKSQ